MTIRFCQSGQREGWACAQAENGVCYQGVGRAPFMVRRRSWWLPNPPGIAPLSARYRAGSYGLLSLLRLELGNSRTAWPGKGERKCQLAGGRTEAA